MSQPPRNVLITGASSGLGRGLAEFFVRHGARVYAAARREPQLQTLREAQGEQLVPVVLDVGDTDRTLDTLQRIDAECGGLDLVVANAGVSLASDARALNWKHVEQVVQVNVLGAAATVSALLPAMVKRNAGQIAAVSSLAGFGPLPGFGAYNASKAFLSMFVESLRMDLLGTDVKLTLIHPGFVKSEMTQENRFPMPFLLETQDAVDRMGQAILRGDAELSFPLPLSLAARAARFLPSRLRALAATRLKPPGGSYSEGLLKG